MGFLRKRKGQSMAEFVFVFPAFLLVMLGMTQLAVIFCNAMMLKYTAYMINRVAVVQADEGTRKEKISAAEAYLKAGMAAANRYEKPGPERLKETALQAAADFAAGGLMRRELTVKEEEIDSSPGKFLRVTVYYNLPLKIPVVNKLFGFFQRDAGHLAASFSGHPVYTLKAASIMRLEQDGDEEDI